MRNAMRKRLLAVFGTVWLGTGCTSERDSFTSPPLSLDIVSLSECNGGYGQLSAPPGGTASLTTPPPGTQPQQLGTVVVYGNPVQRPYRGYGDISSYGGITTVYTYDRNVLNECSFGTDRSYQDLGPAEPEPSPTPIDMRSGVDTLLWSQLTESERRALDGIAEMFTPPNLADAFPLARDFRVGSTFNKGAALYYQGANGCRSRTTADQTPPGKQVGRRSAFES